MSKRVKSDSGSKEKRSNRSPATVSPLAVSKTDVIIACIIAAIALLVYFQTMSRSISYIDGGEITTDLWTLGIPHPTGYPLFMMLGYLFVHIPILPEVAMRANLFAALCTSTAGGLFYLVFVRAQAVLAPNSNNPKSKAPGVAHGAEKLLHLDKGLIIRLSSILGTLVLVFASTFWYQSTSVESYPLELVIFALIMFIWLGFYVVPMKSSAFFSGLILGLGFTNHMTTLLTVPALIFLLISSYRREKFLPRLLLYIALGGLAASLLYLYLPIRASENPLMNWGDPDTLKRFIWQVTGKQFSTWMFSSFAVFKHQLGVFFSSLLTEYRLAILAVVLGLIVSFLFHRRLFWWTLLLAVGDLAYATNYSIHNISAYFLLAYVALALFAAMGFRFVLERFASAKSIKIFAVALLLLFPGISAAANYGVVNESDDYSVEMYTRDILTSLPHDSVVLSFQWDDWVAASLYYQHVDKLRPDVIVIDKELLRRSWYAAQVHQRYRFLFPSNDPIYSAYRENLRLFENGLPYDPSSIQHTYSDFIREIIFGALRDGRDVFVGPEMENKYLYGFHKVPYGLLYELTTDTTYVPFGAAGLTGFRAAQKIHNDYTRQILGFYTEMFLARAQYEYSFHHLHRTLAWLNKSLEVDPALHPAIVAKARIKQELRAK